MANKTEWETLIPKIDSRIGSCAFFPLFFSNPHDGYIVVSDEGEMGVYVCATHLVQQATRTAMRRYSKGLSTYAIKAGLEIELTLVGGACSHLLHVWITA
jgi:hypothetical protein